MKLSVFFVTLWLSLFISLPSHGEEHVGFYVTDDTVLATDVVNTYIAQIDPDAVDGIELIPIEPAVVTTSMTVSVPTAPIPEDVAGAFGLVQEIMKAAPTKDWRLIAPPFLILLVFALRKYVAPQLAKKYVEWVPWILPVTAALAAFATAIQLGYDPVNAGINGVLAGMAAVGANQMAKPVKRRVKKAFTKTPPADPAVSG